MEADAELVRRALARDQQAFAALYDRYADKLYDYSRRLTGNAADAADIVQDTFVLAIQRMHQLRDPSLVRPWLYAIARSEVHRRHRRVNRLQFTEPDEQAAMSSDAPTADDLVHQQELRTLFAEAANGLDPSDREVLELHLRHSMTSAEIAASLGIPERQVSVVVQRVRERLGRSIGVVLLAKTPHCAELTALQRTEGSPLTVLSRKRLARHIEGCLTCSQQLSDRMRPEALLAAVPIALAPAFLRNGVLQRMADVANLATVGNAGSGPAHANNATGNTSTSNTSTSNAPNSNPSNSGSNGGGGDATGSSRQTARQRSSSSRSLQAALPSREGGRVWQESDGFPRPAPSLRRVVLAAIAAAAVLLLFVVAVVNGGDSAKRVAVGATTSFSERSLFPDDATSTSAAATTSPSPTTVATTLAASGLPTSPVITAPPTVKPTAPPTAPTAPATSPTTAPPTTPTTTTPPTTAPDTTAPVFQSAAASPAALSSADAALAPTCIDPSATTSVITANVSDDRGVASVSVQYNAAGTPYNVSMTKVGNAWQVTIGPFPSAQVAPGLHQINAQFTATDTSGNTQAFNAAGIATLLGCTVIL